MINKKTFYHFIEQLFLYFSDRLIELPLAVFGIAISIVMLPVLSEHFQKKESGLYSSTLSKSIKLSMLIAIPSMVGLIILSSSIISTLFMYGNFDLLDVNMTVLSLITYSLGLPAFIFLKILVTAFYSRQDTKLSNPPHINFYLPLTCTNF